jgi:transposase
MAKTHSQIGSVGEPAVYVALELGKAEWHVGCSSGFGTAPWVRTVAARDLGQLAAVVAAARRRFGVPATAPVRSCYEAGRDGFWIHRAVTALGWVNQVVDSSSIEVNRRARQTKTDRIDARKLVTMLVRVWAGEPRVWQVVRVPSEAVEGARHVSRERTALVAARTQLRNQIASWLATCGCAVARRAQTGAWWTQAVDAHGAALAPALRGRLARAAARLTLLEDQIAVLDEEQAATAAATPTGVVARLVQLKGVAVTGASILVEEGLLWREFTNRRQIGGLLGFAPAPYRSGESARDTGIRRAGNARLQAVSIQLAWNWVRWQPLSPLTQWYRHRFGTGRRSRRVGIVAVARKLVIALWRYARTGEVPTGALLKTV